MPTIAASWSVWKLLGEPPPPPRTEGGRRQVPRHPVRRNHQYGYQWVEVGKEELYSLRLNNAAETAPGHEAPWDMVAAARDKEAIRFPPQGGGQIPALQPDDQHADSAHAQGRQHGKKYEYFILTRDLRAGQGSHRRLPVAGGRRRQRARRAGRAFRLQYRRRQSLLRSDQPEQARRGRRQLRASAGHRPRRPDSGSAPSLHQAIRDRGQISGGFTQKSVQELVNILRAGALPATLKPNRSARTPWGRRSAATRSARARCRSASPSWPC